MKKKQPAPANAWHQPARKIGESVRFSFVCCIKKRMGCTAKEAETVFELAVQGGIIVHTGMSGLLQDVSKYRMK